MTITIYNMSDESTYSANISEGATIFDAMESISNLLLSTGYNHLNIVNAHRIEAERMEEAIGKGGSDD